MRLLPRLHLPIAAQVLILTLTAIVVAQGVTLFAVSLAPVLPPPNYSLDQVVSVFHGGKFNNRRNRPLVRRIERELPPEFLTDNDPRMASQLAAALGVSPRDVMVITRGPPPLVLATSFGASHERHPPEGGEQGQPYPGNLPLPGPGEDRGGPMGAGGPDGVPPDPTHSHNGPPPGPRPDGGNTDGYHPFDEFSAAQRRAQGDWLIVEPAPEQEWLPRVGVWLVGGMIIMGPLAWLFARRVTRPIRRFAMAAERLGRDPSAQLDPLDGPAEIGVAANAFNQMHQRLQRYVADRVTMIGAISHDLRTPLTRLRFKVERVEPELRKTILADVGQMESMITGVLAFLRDLDQKSGRKCLDLTSLVVCAVDDRIVLGDAISFDDDTPSFLVDGDELGLRRLIDNLIDNAIKYGETAQIIMDRRQDSVRIAVVDQGPGLPDEQLERVFTPFYRFHEGKDGFGLGLSVARSTARAHGGDLTLRPGATGLIAELILPLADNRTPDEN